MREHIERFRRFVGRRFKDETGYLPEPIRPVLHGVDGEVVYSLEGEGIKITGCVEYPWYGKKREALVVDGFWFGIFGNVIPCSRGAFGDVAQSIIEVKREYDRGNMGPYFGFVKSTFFTKRAETI